MASFSFDKGQFPHIIQVLTAARIGPVADVTGVGLYTEAMEFADELKDMDVVAPVRAEGKFGLGGSLFSDRIFIVQEPWKIKPENVNHRLNIEGTVIADGGVDLPYTNQSGAWTVGEFVTGQVTGTTAQIFADSNPSVGDGILTLVQIRPEGAVFSPSEALVGTLGGAADANGVGVVVDTDPTTDADSSNVTIKIAASSSGIVGTIAVGSGVTAQDKLDIADRVWDETLADHAGADSAGQAQNRLDDIEQNTIDIETKVDIIDGIVDTILADTSEIQSKLPVGGGDIGDATLANQTTMLSDLTDIEAKVDIIDTVVDAIQAKLDKVYGIANANTDYEALQFDSAGRATSFRVIAYSSSDFPGTATEIERWLFTATYNASGNLTSLTVKEGL